MTKAAKTNLAELKIAAEAALVTLQPFIGPRQLQAVRYGMRGEEKQFFYEKMIELAGVVTSMPKTGEQDGKGDNAVAYLHYFAGGSGNWWITEKDMGCDPEPGEERDNGQHQAFGLANFFGGAEDAELGYISIAEMIEHGAELDFHFEPRTLAVLKGRVIEPEKVVAFPTPPTARDAAAKLANL